MERVEPIRNLKMIQNMKNYLLGTGNMRNYALIVLGINLALKISDVLDLTWVVVYDFQEGAFKSHVLVKERKTDKDKKFLLNKIALKGLQRLIEGHSSSGSYGMELYNQKPINKFINKIRIITSRSSGKSMEYRMEKLKQCIIGWLNYFGIADISRLTKELMNG